MTPLVIATILLALVVVAGVLATVAAQSFAIGQSGTGSGTTTGTADNTVNGRTINVHPNNDPRLNQNQNHSQGLVTLGVKSDEKASCDNSENTGHSANIC